MIRKARLAALVAAIVTVVTTPLVAAGGNGRSSAPSANAGSFEVLFVRHAHSTYPEPEQELSSLGISQAAHLSGLLKSKPVQSVDSSIMVRAFQTADGVAAYHDVPVVADEDLREVEVVNTAGLPAEQFNAMSAELSAAWLDGERRDEALGGETYNQVAERWTHWWSSYVREHRGDRGTGVVVAHGLLFALMLPSACANEVSGEFSLHNILANTGMVVARLHPNGTLICSMWNGRPVPSAS